MSGQVTLGSEAPEFFPELVAKLSRSVSLTTHSPAGYFLPVLSPSGQVGGWSVEPLFGNL